MTDEERCEAERLATVAGIHVDDFYARQFYCDGYAAACEVNRNRFPLTMQYMNDLMDAERARSARLLESMRLIRDEKECECFARGVARVAVAEYEASK